MGGSSGSTKSTSTVYQSSLPQYAQPYYESLMGRGQAESTRPYQTYQGPRVADQAAETKSGLSMASNYANSSLQPVQNAINQTGGLTALAANMVNYDPLAVQNSYNGPVGGALQAGQVNSAYNPSLYTAQGINSIYKPGTYNAGTISSNYNPGTLTAGQINSTYSGPLGGAYEAGNFTAGQVGFEGGVPSGVNKLAVGEFDQAAADKYMSPYMQAVVNKAKQDNALNTLEEQTYRNSQAAKSGAFGGSRAAVQNQMALNAMQDRNVDIDVKGAQAAFENAQQQFERDRAASFAAQQGNQQASLSMLQGNQQASLEAQKAREQSRQFGFGATEDARQAAAQMALDAAKSSEQFKQSAYGANQEALQAANKMRMDAQQASEQFKLSGFQANQDALQSAAGMNLDAQKASEQFRQSAYGANQDALSAANQQRMEAQRLSEQFRQSAFGANQDAYQAAASLGLDAQKANQMAGLQGQELGLAGLSQAMKGTEQMTQMQQAWDNMMLDRVKAQLGVGQTKEDYSQERLDLAYDDFVNQRDAQRQNLQFMSSLLQGVPVSANQNVVQNTPTNPVAGAAGSLMGLQALYQLGQQ